VSPLRHPRESVGSVGECPPASHFLKGAEAGESHRPFRHCLLLPPIRFHGDGQKPQWAFARKGAKAQCHRCKERLQCLSTLPPGSSGKGVGASFIQAGRARAVTAGWAPSKGCGWWKKVSRSQGHAANGACRALPSPAV